MYEGKLRLARRGRVSISALLIGIGLVWGAVILWSSTKTHESQESVAKVSSTEVQSLAAVVETPPEVDENDTVLPEVFIAAELGWPVEEIFEEPEEEPVLHDANESELQFTSDSPFDSTALNDVIGLGSGAGGRYGGRFGGRRNFRAAGRNANPKVDNNSSADWSNESYDSVAIGGFRRADEHPLSTFSIDVDSASYTNSRRMLEKGTLPPPAAVRVEEFINYFRYDYARPEGEAPLALDVEVAACPWRPENRLVRVALASRELDTEARQARNLVFLVDVSGSMSNDDKLPLFKRGLKLLVAQLDERDSISIVTYASGTKVALEPTRGDQKQRILDALDGLGASGSTNGSGGIRLAYERASHSFIEGGVNRVLLGTDGDFNVGIQSRDELTAFIQERASSGVFLTVLGFGEGNLKDATLELLADKGNGHYLYVDSMREARRVFVEQTGANLVTVAKDVKLQLEFNPAEVASYRLVGYANRKLAARDFNNDAVDAGEVGAGHAVTALYEIVPAAHASLDGVDPLRYQSLKYAPTPAAESGELLTVKLRYKLSDETESRLISQIATDARSVNDASLDFRFASAVALFGELLAGSPHVANKTFADVLSLLELSLGEDPSGERTQFFDLALKAKELKAQEIASNSRQ